MYRKSVLLIGDLVAVIAVVAAPLQARILSYAGVGATVASFDAAHPNGPGTPPVGVAYYRIDDPRGGRVASYHVVLNPQSKLSTADLKRLVTAGELPADAEQIKSWKHVGGPGYCAVYKSRWLGRALYGPYVIVGVSARDQTAGAWVSAAPFCRG